MSTESKREVIHSLALNSGYDAKMSYEASQTTPAITQVSAACAGFGCPGHSLHRFLTSVTKST